MTLTEDAVHGIMDSLVESREFSIANWRGKRFERIKTSSPTDKGSLGEDLLENLLARLGYKHVEMMKGRKGQWDVKVSNGARECKFEVKVASQDTHGSHQFNGIRHDTKYTHLFLLGVLPDRLLYKIIAKKDRDDHTMTPMQKGSNATYKITIASDKLQSFDCFAQEVLGLLGKAT